MHIPVQTSPVPREVLAFAKKLRVEIIDPTGKVYR